LACLGVGRSTCVTARDGSAPLAGADALAALANRPARSEPAQKGRSSSANWRGETGRAVLGQHPIEHGGQSLGHVAPLAGDRRDRRRDVGRQLGHLALVLRPREGRLAGQQLVERAAQAVDVCADVHRFAGGLLGGHVVGRAHDVARLRALAFLARGVEGGQSQVENLQLPVGVEDQVRGLDVAMHQAVLVGRTQSEGGLAHQLTGIGDSERAAAAHECREVKPLDILHDQEMPVAHLARVHGPHDVRVFQLADGLHLLLEAGDPLRVVHGARQEDFDRHELVELGVQGLVDRAHPALAELLQQAIFADLAGQAGRSRGRRRGRGDGRRDFILAGAGRCPELLQCLLALGLGDELMLGPTLAELLDDRVALFLEGRHRGLASGAALQMSGHLLRRRSGGAAMGVRGQLFGAVAGHGSGEELSVGSCRGQGPGRPATNITGGRYARIPRTPQVVIQQRVTGRGFRHANR